MGKRIFWIFILLVVASTTAAVMYIQSENFAKIAKARIQQTMARDLGLDVNFDRLQIGVLPPSLSLVNVEVKVQSKSNPLNLSPDTIFKAERLGFSFRMIQAFSRGVAINKVFLSDGQIKLLIPKGKSEEPQKLSELVHQLIKIPLGDGMFATIRQLEVRNTNLDLSWKEGTRLNNVKVKNVSYLAVTPSTAGTNIVATLEEIALDVGTVKEKLKVFKANADVQRDSIYLSTLDVQRREAALHAAGKLVGNIDEIENTRPDLDLIVRGPISELADFDKAFATIQGEILADLKLVGRVKDPAIQGNLELNNFRYSSWEVENIKAAGSFGGGFLTLDSLSATQKGGKLSIKNKLELPIPFQPEPRTFQVELANFHLEDFAGDLKKSINNLKMGLDGTVGVRLDFTSGSGAAPKIASVNIRPDLAVKDLELNNQVYGKQRAYKQIFRVQPFKLTGAVQWKDGEVRVNEGKLAFASGAIDAKGTISPTKGFDLYGSTAMVDIGKEVGNIAGQPLTGAGPATLHVHGPDDALLIDFDVEQKSASFAHFDFGEINGRVTYDDGRSYILISNLKGKKNTAVYLVNGEVNVGDGDDIHLDASFAESDPNDIFAIFAEQLKHISWIPHGMGGTIKGTAKVGGGYDKALNSLSISGDISGKNLSYMGEMLHEVEASAELKNAVIKAKINRARKYETPVTGEIEYKLANDEMKYELGAEKGKLRSLDFISSTGSPVDGIFSFHSEGQGKWETLASKTKFELRNAFVRTLPMPPLDIFYETFADRADYQVKLGANAELSGRIGHSLRDDSTAQMRFENADFNYLLCALNRRNCADQGLAFLVDGSAKLNWKGGNWQSMSGGGTIQDLELSRSSFHLKAPNPIQIKVNSGLIEIEKMLLEGEQSKLSLRVKGRVDGGGIDSQLQGDSSLKILEFLTPLIEEARGKMGISLNLVGGLADARFNGAIDLQDGYLRLGGIDAPVDSLNGKIRFKNSQANLDSVTAQLGGGSVQSSGTIDLYLDHAPRFDVDLFFANNRLKFFPVSYAEISDAKLSLTGDKAPYLFGGTVRMKRVMMRNNFDMSGAAKGMQNARYLPEKLGGAKSLYEIRIRAIAENSVFVDNDLLNAEFRGEVTLLNNFEFPQVVARAELVRGKFLFRNTAFDLDHAYIRAPTPEYFNPQFSIGGVTTVDNYRISLFASGTIEKHKISLSSYPAIPQEDIVSLLAFGYRGEDARKVSPNTTSAITYSEVGAILLEQLQLNQNLQSKGLRVTVAPSLNETEANIIRPNSSQTASPKVYLQTQLLKNLDAAFGGTVGSTQGQSLDAKLEYRLGRKASVSAVYEQTPAGLDATETNNSYGGDLKFRWGFK